MGFSHMKESCEAMDTQGWGTDPPNPLTKVGVILLRPDPQEQCSICRARLQGRQMGVMPSHFQSSVDFPNCTDSIDATRLMRVDIHTRGIVQAVDRDSLLESDDPWTTWCPSTLLDPNKSFPYPSSQFRAFLRHLEVPSDEPHTLPLASRV